MWWWFYRIAVDDTGALYEYGYEDKTPTGEIEYIKATGDIIITKKADKDFPDNDSTKGMFYKVVKEGFPEKRIIATG
jgi:hypothetical protein